MSFEITSAGRHSDIRSSQVRGKKGLAKSEGKQSSSDAAVDAVELSAHSEALSAMGAIETADPAVLEAAHERLEDLHYPDADGCQKIANKLLSGLSEDAE